MKRKKLRINLDPNFRDHSHRALLEYLTSTLTPLMARSRQLETIYIRMEEITWKNHLDGQHLSVGEGDINKDDCRDGVKRRTCFD